VAESRVDYKMYEYLWYKIIPSVIKCEIKTNFSIVALALSPGTASELFLENNLLNKLMAENINTDV